MGGRESLSFTVMDDFSISNNTMLIEGRYPAAGDEVLFPGFLSKRYGKGVGDTVDLKLGNNIEEFVISGIGQTLNNGGRIGALTLDGMRRLQRDFQMHEVNIYLNPHVSSREFVDILNDEFGRRIIETMDIGDIMQSQMGTFVVITEAMVVAISVATVLIVSMVLYLIIKTNISQRRRELGIFKAVGYTTVQLMNQISLSVIPAVLLGAAAGGILGGIYINPVLTFLFGTMGIMRTEFTVSASWAVYSVLGISLFSYLVAMAVSWRIKAISAYVLTR
jgi:putative ABC transport system permease protein